MMLKRPMNTSAHVTVFAAKMGNEPTPARLPSPQLEARTTSAQYRRHNHTQFLDPIDERLDDQLVPP